MLITYFRTHDEWFAHASESPPAIAWEKMRKYDDDHIPSIHGSMQNEC
jgi:hypothetical protein